MERVYRRPVSATADAMMGIVGFMRASSLLDCGNAQRPWLRARSL